MVNARILINTAPGKVKSVLDAIGEIEGVVRAVAVFGRYNIVVILSAKNLNEIGTIVLEKISRIEGVTKTETLIDVEYLTSYPSHG